MKEFHFEHATVRVHPSKMSEVEFRANLEAAARQFYKDLQQEKRRKQDEQIRNNASA
jgi:hypothetical protein